MSISVPAVQSYFALGRVCASGVNCVDICGQRCGAALDDVLLGVEVVLPGPDALPHGRAPAVASRRDAAMSISVPAVKRGLALGRICACDATCVDICGQRCGAALD